MSFVTEQETGKQTASKQRGPLWEERPDVEMRNWKQHRNSMDGQRKYLASFGAEIFSVGGASGMWRCGTGIGGKDVKL